MVAKGADSDQTSLLEFNMTTVVSILRIVAHKY